MVGILPVCGAVAGFFVPVFQNFLAKRPVYASIWQHFTYAGGAFGVSYLLNNMWEKRMRNKDLVLFDYIQKHSEDFPEVFTRRKFSDELRPWACVHSWHYKIGGFAEQLFKPFRRPYEYEPLDAWLASNPSARARLEQQQQAAKDNAASGH